MISGGEVGTSSSAMASKQVTASSSMLTHKIQSEELLEGVSNTTAEESGGKKSSHSGARITPRTGNTPLHSPRSMSPLRGLSSTEIFSSEIAPDFQQAIFRANNSQKAVPRDGKNILQQDVMDFEIQKTLKRKEELPTEVVHVATRSKSEITHNQKGQHQLRSKSPFPPSTLRSSAEDMDQGAATPMLSTKRVEAGNAPSSEWVLLDRGRSPRRSKVSSLTVMEAKDLPVERKSSRSSSRKNKVEVMEELPDAGFGMGDGNRATRRMTTHPQTRQHKRKVTESVTVIAGVPPPPASNSVQQSPPLRHRQQQTEDYQVPPYRIGRHSSLTSSPASSSSRRASREARIVVTSDWLQFLGDIIMWRHIPRSALLFGLGCFCIMSASLIQDLQYNTFSLMAYMALFYLAARFIKCNFLRGSSSALSVGMVTEADALRLIRVVLPLFNLMLQSLGDLFSGEPMVTLKVAGALWFLARVASMMNMWTLARIAYFAIFAVPKCYSSYHYQIEAQVRNALRWISSRWSACEHKKAVLFAAFLVVWNFSSVSTRVCGAFLTLVGVRAYRHVIQPELETGSTFFNQDRHMRTGH